jgi:hypothetical protein
MANFGIFTWQCLEYDGTSNFLPINVVQEDTFPQWDVNNVGTLTLLPVFPDTGSSIDISMTAATMYSQYNGYGQAQLLTATVGTLTGSSPTNKEVVFTLPGPFNKVGLWYSYLVVTGTTVDLSPASRVRNWISAWHRNIITG